MEAISQHPHLCDFRRMDDGLEFVEAMLDGKRGLGILGNPHTSPPYSFLSHALYAVLVLKVINSLPKVTPAFRDFYNFGISNQRLAAEFPSLLILCGLCL